MTRAMIEDILRNHVQETHTINQQIAAEQAHLAEDLEELTGVEEIARRRDLAEAAIEQLERRAVEIRQVRRAIDRLPAVSRCTLLMLYYPKARTYEQAAELLGISVSTLLRRRRIAAGRLEREFRKKLTMDDHR